jgi:hypothetical protein
MLACSSFGAHDHAWVQGSSAESIWTLNSFFVEQTIRAFSSSLVVSLEVSVPGAQKVRLFIDYKGRGGAL